MVVMVVMVMMMCGMVVVVLIPLRTTSTRGRCSAVSIIHIEYSFLVLHTLRFAALLGVHPLEPDHFACLGIM